MTAALAPTTPPTLDPRAVEHLILTGDVGGLSREAQVAYVLALCDRLGLDASSHPIQLIKMQGKLVAYLRRDGADQLARIHRVSRRLLDGPKVIQAGGADLAIAVCEATLDGRSETSTGACPLGGDPANALLKAETKAKRRALLSVLGVGILDETEVEDVSRAAVEVKEDAEERAAELAAPLLDKLEEAQTKAEINAIVKEAHGAVPAGTKARLALADAVAAARQRLTESAQ